MKFSLSKNQQTNQPLLKERGQIQNAFDVTGVSSNQYHVQTRIFLLLANFRKTHTLIWLVWVSLVCSNKWECCLSVWPK